jgi:uncharacterized RDD family membrane protein YckC
MSNIPGDPNQPPQPGAYPPPSQPGAYPPPSQPGGFAPPGQPGFPPPGQQGFPQAGFTPPGQAGFGQQPYGQPPMGGYVQQPQFISWGTRVGAYFVDWVISLAVSLVFIILGQVAGIFSTIGSFVSLALSFYLAYLTGATGASPGKRVMGIQVVNAQTGQFIGGGSGMLRSLAHILDAIPCGIGFLFPLWDAKRQTFADKVMSTVVVPGPKLGFADAIKAALPKK